MAQLRRDKKTEPLSPASSPDLRLTKTALVNLDDLRVCQEKAETYLNHVQSFYEAQQTNWIRK